MGSSIALGEEGERGKPSSLEEKGNVKGGVEEDLSLMEEMGTTWQSSDWRWWRWD